MVKYEAKSGEMLWHAPKENPKSTGKPAARSGHTLACANEKAYLFGGCGIEDDAAAVFNDLWMLHITDGFRWEKVDAMGELPHPRWRHSFTFLPDNVTIFLFGGLCRVRAPSPAPDARRQIAPPPPLPAPTHAFAHTAPPTVYPVPYGGALSSNPLSCYPPRSAGQAVQRQPAL